MILHFTASGRPVGERFRLDDGDCDDATGWRLVGLTADRTGASAAFFEGLRNSFQLFAPDGEPAGARTVIGKRTPCSGSRCEQIAATAMDSEGRFAVLWSFQSSTGDPERTVRYSLLAQFFDRAGHAGDRFEVAASQVAQLQAGAAAFDADGNLLVTWIDTVADGPGRFKSRLLFRQVRRD